MAVSVKMDAIPDDDDMKMNNRYLRRPNVSSVRHFQETNRQNEKDYGRSHALEAKLKKYQLSRYIKAFKKKGVTLDGLLSMDTQEIHKLEDEIIDAGAILKHRKFEQFIRNESMWTDYQSKYVKNNSNLNWGVNVNGIVNGNVNGNNVNGNNVTIINNHYYTVNYIQPHNQNYNFGHGSQNYGQQAPAAAAPQQARRGKRWYYYVKNPNVPNGGYFQEYSIENQWLCSELYQRATRSKKNEYRTITTFVPGEKGGEIITKKAMLEMKINGNQIHTSHKADGISYTVVCQEPDCQNRLFNKYQCYPEITPYTPSSIFRSPPMAQQTSYVSQQPGGYQCSNANSTMSSCDLNLVTSNGNCNNNNTRQGPNWGYQ